MKSNVLSYFHVDYVFDSILLFGKSLFAVVSYWDFLLAYQIYSFKSQSAET